MAARAAARAAGPHVRARPGSGVLGRGGPVLPLTDPPWQVVNYTLSPQEGGCRSPSRQICIYNGCFLKTCLMCLIDRNDSLGEARPAAGRALLSVTSTSFIRLFIFLLVWAGRGAARKKNRIPTCEPPYITAGRRALGANDPGGKGGLSCRLPAERGGTSRV